MTHRIMTYAKNKRAIRMPGIIPAISNCATDCSAILASNTAKAEGGINMAIPPTAIIGPIAIAGLYPRFIISGSRTDPNIAVLAIVEPESDEKIVPPTIDTMESLPGRREIIRSIAPIALNATPVWSRISPINKKSVS